MNTASIKVKESLVTVSLEAEIPLTDLENYNRDLLDKRQLANCLLPGDEITLPESASTLPTLAINSHNVIQITSVEYQLPIQILDSDLQPVAGIPVKLATLATTQPFEQSTDTNGIARFFLPMSIDKGLLEYTVGSKRTIRPFYVGTLMPPTTEAGKRQRLNNIFSEANLPLNRSKLASESLSHNLASELDLTTEEIETRLNGALA